MRAEVARRKRERRIFTYDDMLTRLDHALGRSPDAAVRLRARYRVVLVDEFQDTDPVQWSILRRAFHGHTALVLIGDPKQAIYAFRGADVVTYLEATRAADHHATLATNHRSDEPLLEALETVFGGAALGDERIVVHPVAAARAGRRLIGAPADAPVRVRVASRAGLPTPPRRDVPIVGPARELVVADLAADVARLLGSAATIDGMPVRPGDVAVLVRTNEQGATVRAALAACGVPAVVTGTASVFGTPVAADWLTLLEALEQPRLARLRAAALTCFLGRTVEELCGPRADTLLDELGATVRSWAVVLHERGVAALLEAVTTDTELPGRLLARTDGERWLTDLRHVAQALHAVAVDGAPRAGRARRVAAAAHRRGGHRRRDGAQQAAGVRRRRRADHHDPPQQGTGVPGRLRAVRMGPQRARSGRAAAARRHRSGARRRRGERRGLPRALRGASGRGGRRGSPPALRGAHQGEVPGRHLVGAVDHHRHVAGAPAADRTAHAPGTEPAASYRVPSDEAAWAALRGLASPVLAVERVDGDVAAPEVRYTAAGAVRGELTAATFTRSLDRLWRRTSYSALTAGAGHHAGGVTSEPEAPGVQDEPEPAPPDGESAFSTRRVGESSTRLAPISSTAPRR